MSSRKINLNNDERAVLGFLVGQYNPDFGFFSFAAISEETGLERQYVRRACRSLKRKGLTEYGRGLCDDDGEFRGAGYAATATAAEALAA